MATRSELEQSLRMFEQEAAAIREQLAAIPKQWEPEGGGYLINAEGLVLEWSPSGASCTFRSFGVERKTPEAAERAAVEIRKFHRLLAWCNEQCPESSLWIEPDAMTGYVNVKVFVGFHQCTKLRELIKSGEVVL